jgi:hypothetical protein
MNGSKLRRWALAALAAVATGPEAFGDDVPFAHPPPSNPEAVSVVSLADIMAGVQLRHIKLWQAIRAKNWDLVAFEAALMEDSLGAAAMLYRNIPIDYAIAAVKPLGALKDAAKAGEATKMEAIFTNLTAACNACHQAAGVGFVRIETPGSSPFSNQNFAPERK